MYIDSVIKARLCSFCISDSNVIEFENLFFLPYKNCGWFHFDWNFAKYSYIFIQKWVHEWGFFCCKLSQPLSSEHQQLMKIPLTFQFTHWEGNEFEYRKKEPKQHVDDGNRIKSKNETNLYSKNAWSIGFKW